MRTWGPRRRPQRLRSFFGSVQAGRGGRRPGGGGGGSRARSVSSMHSWSGSPARGSRSHAMRSGHWNPYFCISGAHPSRARSHTLRQAGKGFA